MWTTTSTLDSDSFVLLQVDKEQIMRIPLGAQECFIRLETDLGYTGDIVLCCEGETRYFGFLYKPELEVSGKKVIYTYRVGELRRCIEFPCPEFDSDRVQEWHFEPKEALIEYPVEYKVDYNPSLGKWRVRWLKFGLYAIFSVICAVIGLLYYFLCRWSPFAGGLLVGLFSLYLCHTAARASL